jgi:hypothetical protein
MSRMEVKVLGTPLPQGYDKNERGTRKGGYVEQMLSFATMCASFGHQAGIYQHYRLEHVYVSAGLALMDAADEMREAVSLMDATGMDFFEELLPLFDWMQANADWFLMHGGIDLDPRAED